MGECNYWYLLLIRIIWEAHYENKRLLKDILGEMNENTSRIQTRTETAITETDDENGNVLRKIHRHPHLFQFSLKIANGMARHGFSTGQRDKLCSGQKESHYRLCVVTKRQDSYQHSRIW